MKKREVAKSLKLLEPYVERTELVTDDDGSWAITAHWRGGGQKLFWTHDEVCDWVYQRKYR